MIATVLIGAYFGFMPRARAGYRVNADAPKKTLITYEGPNGKSGILCSTKGVPSKHASQYRCTRGQRLPEGTYTFSARSFDPRIRWKKKTLEIGSYEIDADRTLTFNPFAHLKWCVKLPKELVVARARLYTPTGESPLVPTDGQLCTARLAVEDGEHRVAIDFEGKQTHELVLRRAVWNPLVEASELHDPQVKLELVSTHELDDFVVFDRAGRELPIERKASNSGLPYLVLELPHSPDSHTLRVTHPEYLDAEVPILTDPRRTVVKRVEMAYPSLLLTGAQAANVKKIIDRRTKTEHLPNPVIVDGRQVFEFRRLRRGKRKLELDAPGWERQVLELTIGAEPMDTPLLLEGKRLTIGVEVEEGLEWVLEHGEQRVDQGTGSPSTPYITQQSGRYTLTVTGGCEPGLKQTRPEEIDVQYEHRRVRPRFTPARKSVLIDEGCSEGMLYVDGALVAKVRAGESIELEPPVYAGKSGTRALVLRCRELTGHRDWEPAACKDEEDMTLAIAERPASEQLLSRLPHSDVVSLELGERHDGRLQRSPTAQEEPQLQATIDECQVYLPREFATLVELSPRQKEALELQLLSPSPLALIVELPDGEIECVELPARSSQKLTLPPLPGKYWIAVAGTVAAGSRGQPGYALWARTKGEPWRDYQVSASEEFDTLPVRKREGQVRGVYLHPGGSDPDCIGWGAYSPVGHVELRLGHELDLYALSSKSSSGHDLVLTVVAPDAKAYCFDDEPQSGGRSHAKLSAAEGFMPGNYRVWVGRSRPGSQQPTPYDLTVVDTSLARSEP